MGRSSRSVRNFNKFQQGSGQSEAASEGVARCACKSSVWWAMPCTCRAAAPRSSLTTAGAFCALLPQPGAVCGLTYALLRAQGCNRDQDEEPRAAQQGRHHQAGGPAWKALKGLCCTALPCDLLVHKPTRLAMHASPASGWAARTVLVACCWTAGACACKLPAYTACGP